VSQSECFTGNIRMEEGQPSDGWYTSCVDLVTSRFQAADYDPCLGITGKDGWMDASHG
jgi:hypothetical protein